jgi:hypothetical protein
VDKLCRMDIVRGREMWRVRPNPFRSLSLSWGQCLWG